MKVQHEYLDAVLIVVTKLSIKQWTLLILSSRPLGYIEVGTQSLKDYSHHYAAASVSSVRCW